MNQRILRILSLCVVMFATFLGQAKPAEAANDLLRASNCRINSNLITWGGSTVLHPNGLLYITRAISDYSFMSTKAYTAIIVVDPNNIVEGTCPVVATYQDSLEDNYTAFTVKYNPSLAVVDTEGNVFIGKGSGGYYRLMMIPSDAPTTSPFQGMIRRKIAANSGKQFHTFTSLAVTSTHLAIGLSAFNGGEPITPRYATLQISTFKNTSSIAVSWRNFGPKVGKNYDAIVGMPNGNFLIMGDQSEGLLWATFFDPVTNTEKNPNNLSLNGAGTINCNASNAVSSLYGCQTPHAIIGGDGNLYLSVLAVQRSGSDRATVVWKFDTTTNQWSGITGSVATPVTVFRGYENLFGGASMYVDEQGTIALGMGLQYKLPTGVPNSGGFAKIALLYQGAWSEKIAPTTGAAIYGSPDLVLAEVQGQARLVAVYVKEGSPSSHGTFLATYGTPMQGQFAKCKPNLAIEGGAAFVNSTSIGGAVYTKITCNATQYYAVASASATPPTSVSTTALKPFSVANGTIGVTGLTPSATNYIHVRLYDAANKAVDSWMTASVYVDTGTTIGATATINNSSSAPYYLDTYAMRGSSYTAAGHTRSTTGILKITGVTDPSGLNTYSVDGGSPVTYLPNMLNQSIPVSLNPITSTVGISLTLTDGANNSETRGLRSLIMDTEPPNVATPPSVSFTPATSGVFSGTLTISGGSVTDTIYNSTAGKPYWGVWVANAVQSGSCPADDSADLRWGAVPINPSSPTITWNLLNGLKSPAASGTYCTYVRFLDGAGNASTTAISTTTTVTMTAYQSFAPVVFGQR